MDLQDIKKYIESKLNKLPAHIFLDQMRVIDEDARKSFAYNDPTYAPFYYWLGTILNTSSLIDIGFGLGLLSGNFLKACKTVKRFFGIQEPKMEYYALRLGRSNIKDVYKRELFLHYGHLSDEVFEARFRAVDFELAFVNEETSYDKYRYYFDYIWPQIINGGILVVGNIRKVQACGNAYKDLCVSKNLEPTYINTTYGVGLIRKV